MAKTSSKHIHLVAGPNGSGKTSFAESFFQNGGKRVRFINPDAIASGLSPGHEEHSAFLAGRIMVSAVNEAIKKGETFAFESTLSGKGWKPILSLAKTNGYTISLYFLYLNAPSLNIKRIKKRVALGGHDVPSQVVRRRYPRSFGNFWNLYRPFANDWNILDNSNAKPKLKMSMSQWHELTDSGKSTFLKDFLPESK